VLGRSQSRSLEGFEEILSRQRERIEKQLFFGKSDEHKRGEWENACKKLASRAK
jgi:hypothetical protein